MKTSALFFALAFGLPALSPAQIFVGSGGTAGTMTFDGLSVLPASEWATSAAGGANDGGLYTTAGDVIAGIQAFSAATIANPLERIVANSLTELARHHIVGGYLVTQSGSVGATLLKATLRNVTTSAVSHITVRYDFGVVSNSVTESAPGHQVLFSTNGLANHWRSIPGLSGLNTSISVSATLFVGAWLPNTDIYLLWADDNSASNPDGTYSLDNFAVTDVVMTNSARPLSITLTAPANGVLLAPPLTLSANAAGSVAPMGVAFYTNSALAGTDPSHPYSLTLPSLADGTYAIYAVANNATGTVVSATNTVRIRGAFVDYIGGTYTENFDGMGPNGTNAPDGWFVGTTLPANSYDVVVGDGSVFPDGTLAWNYGTAAAGERALGTAATGNERNIVLRWRNNTARSIVRFTLLYDGEAWRNYTNFAINPTLTNFVSYDQGTNWTATGQGFNFTQPTTPAAPFSALDGNHSTNRTANLGGVITPPSPIPPGGVVYLRWHDFNDAGIDGSLAVDSVRLTANYVPLNDTCAGANPLYDGYFDTVNTADATASGDPAALCSFLTDRGVWYQFTPARAGSVTFSVNAPFQTLIGLYANGCAAGNYLTCGYGSVTRDYRDDTAPFDNYRFFVSGSQGNAGNMNVNFSVCEKPYNVRTFFDSVMNVDGGVLVTYRTEYDGDAATAFEWSFTGLTGSPFTSQPYFSQFFDVFTPYPSTVSVTVGNFCGSGQGGTPVNPPCGAICLSIGSPATHTTGNGGSVASPVTSSCGDLDAANTKWFPLGEDPTAAGLAFLSISNSSPDTIITVYRGSIFSVASLVELDCATNGGSKRVARFETRPGGTNYYVAARSTNLAALNIVHGYDLVPPTPVNDLCAGVVPMSPGFIYRNNTLNATSTETAPLTACVPSFGRGVWYSYFANLTGPVLIDTCGSDFDTALQVYTGFCGSLTPFAGGCTNNTSLLCPDSNRAGLRFNAISGNIYYILVGGANQAAGNLVISATDCAAPVFSELTTSVTLESNGVRVLYETAFNSNPPHTWRWGFSDGVTNVTTSNSLSRLFGPFHPFPASVTVSATNLCGSRSNTVPLPPPCEPLCLASALDTNRTHLGTNGSGTNGVSYTNSGGIFPAAGTRWFRLSPLTNSAGVAFISSAGSAPDTRLAVYRTNTFASNALAFVTNSSGVGTQSRVEFETRAGTNYWLAVHTTNGAALQLTYGYQVRFASLTLTNVNGGNHALDLLSLPLPSRQYRLRGGTNLAVPLSNWTALITTNFSNSGSVKTNLLRYRDTNVPLLKQRFYQLERVLP